MNLYFQDLPMGKYIVCGEAHKEGHVVQANCFETVIDRLDNNSEMMMMMVIMVMTMMLMMMMGMMMMMMMMMMVMMIIKSIALRRSSIASITTVR